MGKCFLYGNGSSGGQELNFSVRRFESEDALLAATPKENTIGVVSSTPITDYAFSATQPGLAYKDVDLLSGVTLGNGYFSTTGTVGGPSTANPELYTVDYIPVTYGVNYKWTYTVSATNTMWLSINEYTGSYTHKQRLTPVSSVSGTSQTGTYTPSASTVTAVRLSWRTFPSTTYTMSFVQPDVEYTTGIDNGMVWIKTGTDSSIAFNALKKNTLQVYPLSVKQYISNSWTDTDAKIYQNSAWESFWNGELFENGNQYTSKTGGWSAVLGTLTSENPYFLVSVSGSGNAEISTVNKVDITNYTVLHVIGIGRGDYSNGSAKAVPFGVASAVSGSSFVSSVDLPTGYANANTMPDLTTEKLVDISSLTGEYYIKAYLTNPGAGGNMGIKKVWLT